MSELSIPDRMRIARLRLDRTRRSGVAHVLASPLLRWRHATLRADELLILPKDLRVADPSFAAELGSGHFGLSGVSVSVAGGSPFAVPPPSEAWARELNGFAWLRHMPESDATLAIRARAFVVDWLRRGSRLPRLAFEPDVIGRRLMSWIGNAGVVFTGEDHQHYDRVARRFGTDVRWLMATWRDAPPGYGRLVALTGLVVAHLCLAGHERRLDEIMRPFATELDRQILPDGGHISRNPDILVDILLDLLPLRRCFESRRRPVPEVIPRTVERIMPMLRFMRLGDGGLARFNGGRRTRIEELITVLTYDASGARLGSESPQSRYARLERGEVVIIADVGAPPPLELAAAAGAGCLAFELSLGNELVIVNSGRPGPADADWDALSRATASHNTLVVDGSSSARLVNEPALVSLLGSPPVRSSGRVQAQVVEGPEGIELASQHAAYLARFGLTHVRRLALDADGDTLKGLDRLGPPSVSLRLAQDLPFSIHFHLHPLIDVEEDSEGFVLTTRAGRRLGFSAEGAQVSIEKSRFISDLTGPRASRQIVLRAASFGESEVRWKLERLD